MKTSPSKILVGTLESCPDIPGRIFAFGERDDPMRLTVLLAEHVLKLLPADTEVQAKAQICMDPKASWRQRTRALAGALARTAEQWQGHFVALVDIDALAPQGEESWTSDRPILMRRELFTLLEDAIERGGWLVLRTAPSKSLSPELSRLQIDVAYAVEPEGSAQPDEIKLFAPEVRPVTAWLLRDAGFRPRDLSRIVEDVTNFDAHVVDLAYQVLSPAARDAGKLLAALRPPQRWNGALGPFAYADQRPSATHLPRSAVDELRASGFLQPGLSGAGAHLPVPCRWVCARSRGHVARKEAGQ